MFVHPPTVVNSSPNQDSVLGLIVTGDSCLEILQWIALEWARTSVCAELATLKAQPHRTVNEYCEAFPHLIVFANDEGQVTGTCTQEELLAALLRGKRHEYSDEAKELFRKYFLSNREKLPLLTIHSFDGEHRDFLNNEVPSSAQQSFAGRSSVEIGYSQDAILKGDKREHFRTFDFTVMGDRQREWLKRESTYKPACEVRKPELKFVDPVVVHSEGERQAQLMTARRFTVSAAQRAKYEAKLLADVAAYHEKDQKRREEARLYDVFVKTDAVKAAEAQDVFGESLLIRAIQRVKAVRQMSRKGTISKSAVEEAKEYLMGLLIQVQLEDHPIVIKFMRQEDLNLATNF